MSARLVLTFTLVIASALPATKPWDRPPEQWSKVDALHVLQDSPWSPAKVKLDAKFTYRHTDPETGIVSESTLNPTDQPPVRGVEFSRHKAAPPVTVLWWSSKTVRSARLRLQQLIQSPNTASPVRVDDLPDYVLAIEGDEPVRIFGNALEKVQDTVFLETVDGTTINLCSIRLVNAPDGGPRVEFHFPRQVNGQPSLDVNAERVTFHCRATAKTPIPGRTNAIALRAEFEPRTMLARGVPDL